MKLHAAECSAFCRSSGLLSAQFGLRSLVFARLLNLPSAVRALILCAFPWLVTGFLHLDGFMDVCDAVLSRCDLETRQRILKDSHCGSFAVICMILLAAAQWSLFFSFRIFRFQSIVDACGSARLHTRLFRDCGSNAETDANEPVQRSCSERGLRRFALCSARTPFLHFPRCSAAKSVLRRLRLLRYIGFAFCAKKSSSAA